MRFLNGTDWVGLGCAPAERFIGSKREDGAPQTFADLKTIRAWDKQVRRETGATPAVVVLDSMTKNDAGERWQPDKIAERVEFAARRGGVVAFDLEPEANYAPEMRGNRLETQAELWERLRTGRYADGTAYTAYQSDNSDVEAAGFVSWQLRRRLAEACYWTPRPVPYCFWRWPRHLYDSLHDGPTMSPLLLGGAIKAYFRENPGDFLAAWRARVVAELRVLHSVPTRGRGRRIAWINTHECYEPHAPIALEDLREMLDFLQDVGGIDTILWWAAGNYWGIPFDPSAGWYRVMGVGP